MLTLYLKQYSIIILYNSYKWTVNGENDHTKITKRLFHPTSGRCTFGGRYGNLSNFTQSEINK
jgi:hypothetical protein